MRCVKIVRVCCVQVKVCVCAVACLFILNTPPQPPLTALSLQLWLHKQKWEGRITHDEIMRCYANMLLQSSATVLDANVQKPPHRHRSAGNSKQIRTSNLTAMSKLCSGSHLCKVLWDSIIIILFITYLCFLGPFGIVSNVVCSLNIPKQLKYTLRLS